MSAIVNRLDSVISYLANKADTPSIDYLNLVVAFGWIQTLFEVSLLYVAIFSPDSLSKLSSQNPCFTRRSGC
jgi:hypothetical protein